MDTTQKYLDHLNALPFVKSVSMSKGSLVLRTRWGNVAFTVMELKSHLAVGFARQLVAHADRERPLLLLVPHVGATLGEFLAEHGVNYVDRQGNCHLEHDRVFVHVQGKPTGSSDISKRGVRAPGYQALYAFLAAPEVINLPVRVGAEQAGVSKQAVHQMRMRLVEDGALLRAGEVFEWTARGRRDALQRWLNGYRDTVRPSLLLGTYRTRFREPDLLEEAIKKALPARHERWVWGGTAAGFRLNGIYRGPQTVVHLEDPGTLIPALRAIPDAKGDLVLLSPLGKLAGRSPDTAHPLLVYSEMTAGDDDRAHDAARELLKEFIEPTWNPA